MPALETVVYTSTDAASGTITMTAPATQLIKSGTSNEASLGQATTFVNAHYDFTIPVGMIGFTSAVEHDDLSASPSVTYLSVIGGIMIGTGSNIPYSVGTVSPNGTAYTTNDNVNLSYHTVIRVEKLKSVITGF